MLGCLWHDCCYSLISEGKVNMSKLNKVINIINSCKTYEQLDSCYKWVPQLKNIVVEPSSYSIENYIIRQQLLQMINAKQLEIVRSK